MLLPEKELSRLPDNSSNIFKRSNIDRYMERPSATFSEIKYRVLNDICYAGFLAYCTFENKSNKTCKYQPDDLGDNLIENKHEECSYPKRIKSAELMSVQVFPSNRIISFLHILVWCY